MLGGHAGVAAAGREDAVDQLLFELEVRARGVAQLLPVDRQHAPVAPTERLALAGLVGDQGDHVLGREEAVGRRLQARAIDAGARRQLLADGLQDLVARERRSASREAGEAGEPLEQAIPLPRARLLRARPAR